MCFCFCLFLFCCPEMLEYSDERRPWESMEEKLTLIRYCCSLSALFVCCVNRNVMIRISRASTDKDKTLGVLDVNRTQDFHGILRLRDKNSALNFTFFLFNGPSVKFAIFVFLLLCCSKFNQQALRIDDKLGQNCDCSLKLS